ncbi:MAG: DUF4012 domain-containing protein [Demequina sp.]|nr:DUF4012 domain-containing protein [Demequina sp.]
MTTYQHAEPPRPKARRRVWLWIVLAIAVLTLLAAALFAWDAVQIQRSASALETEAAAAKTAVTNRDADALQTQVAALSESAHTFASATSGPHWWVANHLPWVKNQTLPLHQAGVSVLAVTDDALTPLAQMDNLSALQAPAIENGRIDPHLFDPYADTLAESAAVFERENAALAAIDPTTAVARVRDPFLELRDQFADLGELVSGANVAAQVFPSMLGADGARTYLVMVQNNAEPRTTGGIAGAVLEVRVDDGALALVKYVSAASMVDTDGIDVPLTPDEDNIFGERMQIYPQDVNFTPEYPRSATLLAGFWKNEFGEDVDGVISLDPVALGYMLDGMDPVTVGTLEITGPTLAQVMLNESYFAYPEPADQDAFFAQASGVLFGVLMEGATSAIDGTERAIDEHRFMVWSAHADEQELLAPTRIAGSFLQRTGTVGIFLNDGSGSKIGYYIAQDTSVVNHMCSNGTLSGQTLTVTLTHTFDGDVASLPWYISGGGVYVPEGEFHANVLLYPPNGEGSDKNHRGRGAA